MEHITVGRKYNEGKTALVECLKNDNLKNIDIKGKCFLLIILTKGRLKFEVGGETVTAATPSFLCFDETENPVLVSKSKARYTCIYFHPQFLNINMTFKLLRSQKYGDIASAHDMFLLKPFTAKARVIPICESQLERIECAADYMQRELEEQRVIYSVTRISTDKGAVGFIGGADFPTLLFILQMNGFIQLFFILESIAAGVSLTILAFKSPKIKYMHIIIAVLISVTALLFLLIPTQSYTVSLYTVLRKIPLLKYVNLIYILFSAINVLLPVIKEKH